MKKTPIQEYDWALRVLAIEKARGLQETPHETLDKIYARLTDEQKIAFILAGGMPSLLHHQHRGMGSDPQTGQLPILC